MLAWSLWVRCNNPNGQHTVEHTSVGELRHQVDMQLCQIQVLKLDDVGVSQRGEDLHNLPLSGSISVLFEVPAHCHHCYTLSLLGGTIHLPKVTYNDQLL